MAATPTVRHLDTTTSAQTLASPSLTPAADSLWIIVATASEQTDTYVFNWGISGGAESYEAWDGTGGTTDLELSDSFSTGFGDDTWGQFVWVQQFGASPAARVVTVDPDADGTDVSSGIGLIIIEVTGHDTGDPIAQAVAGHTQDPPLSGPLSQTTSFGSAPSGSQVYAAIAENNPAATFDTPPSGWSQSDVDEGTVPYSLEVGESTTNTATGVTVATDSGATYHLGVTLFEFNDAPVTYSIGPAASGEAAGSLTGSKAGDLGAVAPVRARGRSAWRRPGMLARSGRARPRVLWPARRRSISGRSGRVRPRGRCPWSWPSRSGRLFRLRPRGR